MDWPQNTQATGRSRTRKRPLDPIIAELAAASLADVRTQTQQAQAMGLSQNRYSDILTGKQCPRLATMVAVAANLGYELRLSAGGRARP